MDVFSNFGLWGGGWTGWIIPFLFGLSVVVFFHELGHFLIARLVEATINDWIRAGNLAPLSSADDAISIDHNARNRAAALLPQIALKAS